MGAYHKRNLRLKDMGFESYEDYLRSDLWRCIRAYVLRDNAKCARCGLRATQVHHKMYTIGILEGRHDKFLLPVCKKCHHDSEFDMDGNKRSMRSVNRVLKLPPSVQPEEVKCKYCGRITGSQRPSCRDCRKKNRNSSHDRIDNKPIFDGFHGKSCPKCGTLSVEWRKHPSNWKRGKGGYYTRWTVCQNCNRVELFEQYHVR